MSAISYFSSRLLAMRVVWEESPPSWMVLTGLSSAPYGCTLGTLVGALVQEVKRPSPHHPGERFLPLGRATSRQLQAQRHGRLAR
jgi:hypothetical protein